MPNLPLEGVRILDLSHVYAGPTCSRILADLGADVIKVEGLTRSDIIRSLVVADNDAQGDFWNRSGYFLFRNAGKRSLTLDFTNAKAVELFKSLVSQTDVVIESFTPRVMRNFGLDYQVLCQLKPDLIMISMSGYGQTGPWADYTAYGMGLEPASGISQITGYRGGPPIRSGISFTDPLTGIVGAGAVLTALHYRRRTGQGQYIDLSEQEAAIAVVGQALMDYVMNGRVRDRQGNRSQVAAPQGCYRCRGRDDWLVISINSDDEWQAFCHSVGHAEWAADPRFADVVSRHRHHDELDTIIEGWTQSQDKMEAMHLLQQAGVTAAAVLNPKEVLLNPHLKERDFFDVVEQPGVGRVPVPRPLAVKFSDFEPRARGHAPKLGEHNQEILQGLLGLSDADLKQLEAEQVIGSQPAAAAAPAEVLRQVVQWPLESLKEMGAILDIEDDHRQQLRLP